MESEGGKMESDPPSPSPARALFQPEYRSQRDPSCLSFSTLSRQALINISTLLCQPLGVKRNRYNAEAHTHTHTENHNVALITARVHADVHTQSISSEMFINRSATRAACEAPPCNRPARRLQHGGESCCSLLNGGEGPMVGGGRKAGDEE